MGKVPVSEQQLRLWGHCIMDPSEKLVERSRALWGLRHASEKLAVDLIGSFLTDFVEPSPSADVLLQHEAAYILGQRGDCEAIPILIQAMRNADHHPVVRHEAAEALAALCGSPGVDLDVVEACLNEFLHCDVVELAETCEVGLGRVNWLRQQHNSPPTKQIALVTFPYTVDPAPSWSVDARVSEEKLRDIMMNPNEPLFTRYRALFSLRDCILEAKLHHPLDAHALTKAALLLGEGLHAPGSALLRHEVAYVLGQLAVKENVPQLADCVQLTSEHPMVRHEAAEALGSVVGAIEAENSHEISDADSKLVSLALKVLRENMQDKEAVVRESCVVALDIADYVASTSQFQYVAVPHSTCADELENGHHG